MCLNNQYSKKNEFFLRKKIYIFIRVKNFYSCFWWSKKIFTIWIFFKKIICKYFVRKVDVRTFSYVMVKSAIHVISSICKSILMMSTYNRINSIKSIFIGERNNFIASNDLRNNSKGMKKMLAIPWFFFKKNLFQRINCLHLISLIGKYFFSLNLNQWSQWTLKKEKHDDEMRKLYLN